MKEDIFDDDQPENHSGYLIWQISNMRQRTINAGLKDLELTYPQFVILSGIHWLNQNGGVVNQVKLIQFTKMDKSVVSSVLKSLEKRQIVIREVDPIDTRAKKLGLSDLGLDKLKQALDLIKQIDMNFFDQDQIDMQGFNNMLKQLINHNSR
ncbi:MarR family transcriptional regulator [Vibrio sp. DW001]|uniref:MarR family winged helix-turn-helix transcriptional regulator n=1 Tax=Vibrio sp. DW001 TaxID=2912315 RepID=UPI0023B1D0FC|nr:MarR family transcriptional regulator [Vibrio sp. DW001]WED29427.1 MarR family transcriptional regulator [Vibrio sp. DW001]